MNNNRQQAIELVKKALLYASRKTGYKAFELSRQKCPIVTGHLKSTAKDKILDQGYEFIYNCEYASFPERGVPPGIRYVRTYRRKDGVIVRAHSFFSKGQKAQHYIGNSTKEAFIDFARDFEDELKSSGLKVTRV